MKNVFNTIKYDLYLLLVIGLTFASFTGYITDIYFPLIILLAIIMMLLKTNVLYIVAIAMASQMSFSGMRDNADVTTLYTSVIVFLLVVDVIKNRKITKLGYLMLPLLILSGLALLTGFNGISRYVTLVGFFQILSVTLMYFYFVNTFENRQDNFVMISKIFMYLAMLVTIEMLYYIWTTDELMITLIRQRTIDLGWENLNIIIYANIMSIPLIGYLVVKSKVKLPYMFLALFSILGILLTLSRSSILTVAVYVVVLVPLMFYHEKKKMSLIIQGLLFVMFVSMGLFFLEQHDIISEYYLTLMNRDVLHFDDRLILLEIAYENFKQHPIIGSGGIFSSRYLIAEAGEEAINYHNTFAQASTLGILGLIGLVFLFFRKIKLIISSVDDFKWYALLLLLATAFVNGSLQPMYFYASYMIYIFMILASLEVNKAKKSTE